MTKVEIKAKETHAHQYANYLVSLDMDNPDSKHLALKRFLEMNGTFYEFVGMRYLGFDDGSVAIMDICFPNQILVRWDVLDHPMVWEETVYFHKPQSNAFLVEA